MTSKKRPKLIEVLEEPVAEPLLLDGDTSVEGEDDLVPTRPEGIRQAVVTGTDWTTETIIRLIDRGTIELDPTFQRRDAWSPARKSRFIESLVMGLPIPQIVLAERKDKRGQFIVLDGKQRLLTLQQFAGDLSGTDTKRLALSDLVTLQDMNGITYGAFEEKPRFADDLEAFRNQPVRTVVVKNWPDENFLFLVFLRLNTGSVPLAPQELRQALHPGSFVGFANKRSEVSEPLRRCLRIERPDFRMRDVELMVRFFAFQLFMSHYAGNMKLFLDETCRKLNESWSREQGRLEKLADELDAAIKASESFFEEGALFSVWRGAKSEHRFNRAVFDVFVYYLADPVRRKAALAKRSSIVKMFRDLCTNDRQFLTSIQITTKSLTSVHARFDIFGRELSKAIGKKIPKLDLIDDRLLERA